MLSRSSELHSEASAVVRKACPWSTQILRIQPGVRPPWGNFGLVTPSRLAEASSGADEDLLVMRVGSLKLKAEAGRRPSDTRPASLPYAS